MKAQVNRLREVMDVQFLRTLGWETCVTYMGEAKCRALRALLPPGERK